MSVQLLSSYQILSVLQNNAEDLKIRFGVEKIGLFGSYARDDQSENSDIDILVQFSEASFDHYMDLKFYLEKLYNHPVDLVLFDSIKPRMKPYIMDEVRFAQGL
ncbi:MAG TPA: nucleotidyltransferase family protein [Spirochaetota bacterium]|nr:nucleotidyltransferase family protein [Spirochaetota bacterium]HPC43347.1 nucleotidyltransferase family protein [Spirochaetota bacterium]HPL16243.1 nucleotidyltransferase family protein [Spirochaetota bacterium]HQF08418.1 nucleotidyltransferase family protein [Spirochaetota bacterium]HQH99055.1 nucleotidyltransferase family protein [Spirochaetota bacterium]